MDSVHLQQYLFCAGNDENTVFARVLEENRDNLRNLKNVFFKIRR